QHVGALEQTGQDGLALLGVEIEGDRLLVPVELREVPRQAFHDRALLAERIALARRLDLDHLGPHVAEEHAAERARENAGQVDDAETGQGQGRILLPHGNSRRRVARRRARAVSSDVTDWPW